MASCGEKVIAVETQTLQETIAIMQKSIDDSKNPREQIVLRNFVVTEKTVVSN